MSILDLAIVALVATAVYGGYRLGLVTGATTWVFLAQGLVCATLLLPDLDRRIGPTNPGTAIMLEALVFVSSGFAALYVGRAMGRAFRSALLPARLEARDRLAGAVGGPVAVLLLVWLLALPAMSQSPGFFARQAHGSLLARGIDAVLPAPPDTSRAFHRLVGPAGMPQVFASLDPLFTDMAPPIDAGVPPHVVARVSNSTVKVDGVACRRRRQGSGFTVAPDVVATNAHVVAGERQTSVIRPDGVRLPAVVTAFDPDRDLALLRVPGLDQPPLALASPVARTAGVVFGHPDGQADLAVSPALIRRELLATGYDLYADHTIRRDVLVLAANLHPGDSGSALVNTRGSVVGVAFAISLSSENMAFALSTEELRGLLATNGTAPVSTGECLA